MHLPLFKHGDDAHLSTIILQSGPLNPCLHWQLQMSKSGLVLIKYATKWSIQIVNHRSKLHRSNIMS